MTQKAEISGLEAEGAWPHVVVGAGFAGLSAATVLAARGHKVLVLDARPRLGGRATAFPDRETGELVDNGQHVMFGCYRETLAFLERIGAGANVSAQPALEIPFIAPDGRRTVLRCPTRLPAPLHLLAGVLGWKGLPLLDRLSALRIAPALLGRAGVEAGSETVAQWLRTHGQRDGLITALWEPLAIAALNQPIEQAAAAPFARVLTEMFGPDRTAASLVLPTKPLHQMYAEPARTFIERHGGEVRTNALARITIGEAGVTGVEVRGERIPASSVIAAVPWHALRTLFPTPPPALAQTIANASAMTSMPIVTVNLWYDRIIMDEAFVGLTGRTVQWVFDKRRAFGEHASHLSLVVSAAEALAPLSSEELIGIAVREVSASLPAAGAATLVRATVVREKQATFSLAPGQPPRPSNQTAVPGLALAGDWTDTSLPGTIESAVLSGRLAALAALR